MSSRSHAMAAAAAGAPTVYREFMALVIELEGLQRTGGQMLRNFQQELDQHLLRSCSPLSVLPELFRRPALNKESVVLSKVLEGAPSPRLARYLEAGCRDTHADRLNVTRLDAAMEGLLRHKEHAGKLIQELESRLEPATLAATQECDAHLSKAIALASELDSEEEAQNRSSEGPQSPDYATMTALLLGMFRKDFTMQAKIIDALGLHTPGEPLESYCTMWTLRPFIDDEILVQAFKLTEY